MNILRFFESFRTCETERAPNAKQNNGFFPDILSNNIKGLPPADANVLILNENRIPGIKKVPPGRDYTCVSGCFFLFGHHFKFHLGALAITEFDTGFIGTKLFHFIYDLNFLAVDLITSLLADGAAKLQ
jgi:hypothetical protein